ncbi:hypothetical protein [Flagellimonas sp. S3867]|uniref:hypothetical protein n=1 Tax=Flagellimonas sp. S3867 TaxID=2768063 RepID=UPI001687FD4A|nr:hypothetical protein [Flagellimonas sp. S3867]
MKHLLFAVILVTSLTRCSNNDDDMKTDIISGTWSISNISGGFAGINDDYASGIITWTFSATTSKLQVVNNNGLAGIIYDGLPTGTYDYTILGTEKESFLSINGQEFAGIIVSEGQLVLDQNKMSSGSGADGFVLRFNP